MLRAAWIVFFVSLVVGCRDKGAVPPFDAGPPAKVAARPRLGFRLSDASPAAVPPRAAVRGTPLGERETEELLARAPGLPDGGAPPTFALREASQPAPRPGRTVPEAFPPKSDATAPPSTAPAGPLRVARHAPIGEVPIAANVSVTFSAPMVPIATVSMLAAKDPPVTITPRTPGSFRWLGTDTLVFQPDGELPKATEYVIDIPAGTKSVTGAALEKAERFTFSTLPPKLVDSAPSGNDVSREPLLYAAFDQKIDPAAVLKKLTLKAEGLDFGARLATAAELAADEDIAERVKASEKKGKGRTLVFKPARTLPPNTVVEITFPVGTPSAEGPRVTTEPQKMELTTHRALEVLAAECAAQGGRCYPTSVIDVETSTAIDDEVFDPKLLTVTPEVPELEIDAPGRRIRVTGRFKVGQKYTFTVAAGLRDRHGQVLAKPATRYVDIEPLPPSFSSERQPMIVLDPHGPARMSVYATNDKTAHARLYKVTARDYEAYERWRAAWDGEGKELTPPGRLVFDADVPLVAKDDAMAESLIDLSPGLEGGRGNVLAVVQTLRPYKERWQREWHRQWVQVTSIGLTAHESRGGSLSVVAAGIARGEPLSGVGIGFGQGPLAQTDEGGIALLTGARRGLLFASRGADEAFLPGLLDLGSPLPFRVDVHAWNDRGLYKPGETVNVKGLVRRISETGAYAVDVPPEFARARLAYEATDARGASLGKGTAQVDEAGGFNLALKIPDKSNLGYANVSMRIGDREFAHAFDIEEFRRPEYQVSASAEPGPHVVGGSAVATVSASYFAGGALVAAEATWNAERIDATFTPPNQGDYHFGRAPEPWFFVDSTAPRDAKDPRTATFRGRTDAHGEHRLRVDFEGTVEPYPFSVSLAAQVTDVNRQAFVEHTSLLVHPARLTAGIKLDKPFVRAGDPLEPLLVASELDGKLASGVRLRLRSTRATRERVRGKWTTKEVDEARCEVVSDEKAPAKCPLATKGAGYYTITVELEDKDGHRSRSTLGAWVSGAGIDERTLREGALEIASDRTRYAPGDKASLLLTAPFAPADGLLEVRDGAVTRRQRVHLKERVSTLVVPIESGDIPGVTVTVSLVGESPRRNARGDLDTSLQPRPAYASGSIALMVPPDDHHLAVEVTPEVATLAPGGATSIAVAVKDARGAPAAGSEVALVVVDESVLALSRHTIEDPLTRFFVARHDTPHVLDLRAYVALSPLDLVRRERGALEDPNAPASVWGREIGDAFGAGGLGLSGVGEGGGGRGEGIGLGNIGTLGHGSAPAANARRAAAREAAEFGMIGLLSTTTPADAGPRAKISVRSRFDALALFAARVATDASGRATVPVKLPDSTTRFRVTAVAWDKKDRFGRGESALTARLPLIVRPSAPRFLNYGDRFELPLTVQNQTDAPLHVSLAARAANAVLDEKVGRAFDVPPNDRVEVRLPARAAQPGRALFQLVAAAGDFADAASTELPVWSPGTTEAFATYGVVDSGAVGQAIALPKDVEKGFGGLEISTSSTALFALSDAVLYLQRYPFDCNEQLASRVLSIASLRDLLGAFASSQLPPPAALRAGVDADLARLRARQDPSSGGFGFWAGEPWPYLTVHVALALALAREKGFAVDAGMLSRVSGYLHAIDSHIPSGYSAETRRALRAYALFVLERLGQRDGDAARRLVDEAGGLEKLPLESVAWLHPTFASGADTASLARESERLFENRAVETAGAAHFTTSYGEGDYLVLASEHRADALVLLALLRTNPKSPLVPKVVAGLLGGRKNGHWASTQEDAFVLLALDAYFQRFEKVAPSFVARVWLGDRPASEHAYRGFNVDRAESMVPMAELDRLGGSSLVVDKDGAAGRLYYRLGLKYAPSSLSLPPIERGFSVMRVYEPVGERKDEVRRDPDGVWHVKAGAAVRVRVSMVAPSERHHVALVDPMPAGFEALNSGLAGTPIVPPAAGMPGDPLGDLHPTFGGLGGLGGLGGFGWRGYFGPWYEHENLRDERAEAFAAVLPGGAYEYVYTARATTPGTFVVPPPKAEEMYAPETFGRGAGDRVVIDPP